MSAWLGVVSQAHVLKAVAGGFAQLCHGKAQPLRRMQRGDWLIDYSPALEMGGVPLRAFTAIVRVGRVTDDEVFQVDLGGGFLPFRRQVRYLRGSPAAISKLAPSLDLCAPRDWGIALRRGHLSLSLRDLETIAAAMGVSLAGSGAGGLAGAR